MNWIYRRRYEEDTGLPYIQDLEKSEIESILKIVINRMLHNKYETDIQEKLAIYLNKLIESYPHYLSLEVVKILNISTKYFPNNICLLNIFSSLLFLYKQMNSVQ